MSVATESLLADIRHPISYRFEVIAYYCLNFGHCVFEPRLESSGLWTTYTVHLRLTGKLVMEFASIELFTALHGMQTRSSDEISVCPSVCPSVKSVHCDKTEESYV